MTDLSTEQREAIKEVLRRLEYLENSYSYGGDEDFSGMAAVGLLKDLVVALLMPETPSSEPEPPFQPGGKSSGWWPELMAAAEQAKNAPMPDRFNDLCKDCGQPRGQHSAIGVFMGDEHYCPAEPNEPSYRGFSETRIFREADGSPSPR